MSVDEKREPAVPAYDVDKKQHDVHVSTYQVDTGALVGGSEVDLDPAEATRIRWVALSHSGVHI
jgi:hypothetical protein